MKLAVVFQSGKDLEVKIEGEDVSVADVVHHELLKDRDIVFAGVRPPHPPLKTLYLRVQTAKGAPKTAIVSSGKRAAENVKPLLTELKKLSKAM